MTTFTTEDRELIELHIKTYLPAQECALMHLPSITNQLKNNTNTKALLHYRIEDSSEDLSD